MTGPRKLPGFTDTNERHEVVLDVLFVSGVNYCADICSRSCQLHYDHLRKSQGDGPNAFQKGPHFTEPSKERCNVVNSNPHLIIHKRVIRGIETGKMEAI